MQANLIEGLTTIPSVWKLLPSLARCQWLQEETASL